MSGIDSRDLLKTFSVVRFAINTKVNFFGKTQSLNTLLAQTADISPPGRKFAGVQVCSRKTSYSWQSRESFVMSLIWNPRDRKVPILAKALRRKEENTVAVSERAERLFRTFLSGDDKVKTKSFAFVLFSRWVAAVGPFLRAWPQIWRLMSEAFLYKLWDSLEIFEFLMNFSEISEIARKSKCGSFRIMIQSG